MCFASNSASSSRPCRSGWDWIDSLLAVVSLLCLVAALVCAFTVLPNSKQTSPSEGYYYRHSDTDYWNPQPLAYNYMYMYPDDPAPVDPYDTMIAEGAPDPYYYYTPADWQQWASTDVVQAECYVTSVSYNNNCGCVPNPVGEWCGTPDLPYYSDNDGYPDNNWDDVIYGDDPIPVEPGYNNPGNGGAPLTGGSRSSGGDAGMPASGSASSARGPPAPQYTETGEPVFRCGVVDVQYEDANGNMQNGTLYEDVDEEDNFPRCTFSSCLPEYQQNEEYLASMYAPYQTPSYSFTCYYYPNRPQVLYTVQPEPYVWYTSAGVHSVLWPALACVLLVLVIIIRKLVQIAKRSRPSTTCAPTPSVVDSPPAYAAAMQQNGDVCKEKPPLDGPVVEAV